MVDPTLRPSTMSLLHWCTVSPQGPSGLAAIRFTAPIRVSSIRVFPNGAQPFRDCPDVVAETEPDAFYVDIFFNAHPLLQPDSKEKQRAPNALVPTSIAYPGGLMDFTVDMGTEYATRLMIVKGTFEKLSMAIYGQVVSEAPPIIPYAPTLVSASEQHPLSKAIDPSSTIHPTTLASELLSIIPNAPPLSLIIRLMFCLKPSDDDWEDPQFPYLYANLDNEDEDMDLDSIILSISHPISDDTSFETLSKFANRVAQFLGQNDIGQSHQVAKILSISASQIPEMAQALLQQLELSTIFDQETIDEPTVLCLLDAASNVEIARRLGENEDFLKTLEGIQENPRSDKHTQAAVRRLITRIRAWRTFEDALSNTRGDFAASAIMLSDIGTEEQSIAIWLESMIIHPDLVTKLGENPVLPIAQSPLPSLFQNPLTPISHDEFIAFVRALIGVASVLAVWAWADSTGNDACRERTMLVLKLWQGVDGYREILNHLLLLRQFTRRLGWIAMDNDLPRKSGVLAERVLVELSKDPRASLCDELARTILSLEPPLSFIAENERLSMRKIALVAQDGLPAAIDELTFTSDRPFSVRRLRVLRVSLAIVERELVEDARGEWRVLQTLWDEHSHGLSRRLVEILSDVADDLNGHFTVQSIPVMNQTLTDLLFRIADDLMRLINLQVPAFPLTTRELRNLTVAVADLFACTDLADMIFSQSSSACVAAQITRQTCLNVLRSLSEPAAYAEPRKLGAEVVLRTLLGHSSQSSGRDPVNHLQQIFSLIDCILPDPASTHDIGEESHWVVSVIPKVISELEAFFRLLDDENQVHLVKRLVKLDEGVIGVGEWLLMEEFKHLSLVLRDLDQPSLSAEYQMVQRYQVYQAIRFLWRLITPPSNASEWCITCLSGNLEMSGLLIECLGGLLQGYYTSPHLSELVHFLAKEAKSFSVDLQFTVLLSILRILQTDATSTITFGDVLTLLETIPAEGIEAEPLRLELGRAFHAYAVSTFESDSLWSNDILRILEWLARQGDTKLTTLCGISAAVFEGLCDSLTANLSSLEGNKLDTRLDDFNEVRKKLVVDDDEVFTPSTVELPDHLELSIENIKKMLESEVPVPTTPKGSKTPDILGVIISPPTAVLRSHAATGLTKTYMNNDFRQLRQAASARLNTSRLPSMHVDVGINGRLTSVLC